MRNFSFCLKGIVAFLCLSVTILAYEVIGFVPYDSISGGTTGDSLFSLEKLAARTVVNRGNASPLSDSLVLRITIIPIHFSVIKLDVGESGAWFAYYALQSAEPVHCKTDKCSESGRLGKSASDSTIAYYESGVLKNVVSGMLGTSDAVKIKALSKALRSSKGGDFKLSLGLDCPRFLVSEKIGSDSSVKFFSRPGDAKKIHAIAEIFSVLAGERDTWEMTTLAEVVKLQMNYLCKD